MGKPSASVCGSRRGRRGSAQARDIFRYDRREGGFTGWVEKRLKISERTAYDMINVHERLSESLRHGANIESLSAKALYALAAPSTHEEVRDAVKQLLIDGQKVGVRCSRVLPE